MEEREQDFIEALTNAPTDPTEHWAFVKAQLDEAKAPTRAALRVWATAERELAHQAFSYLIDVEDLAIEPVMEGPVREEPKNAARALDLLIDAELAIRISILRRVDKLLDDKRPVPEQPARRVCDEAYAALRRLVQFGDAQGRPTIALEQFFALPEIYRDQEIAAVRATNTWRRMFNPGADVDDD